MEPSLCVIIVSWNTKELLRRCLESLSIKNRKLDFLTIVVDNCSSDGSTQMVESCFPQVKLIKNSENVGFARANNQAIRLTNTKFILLLNSDTEFKTNESLLDIVVYADQHPRVGVIGALLLFADETVQAAGRDFISVWGLVKSQLLFFRSRLIKKLMNKYHEKDRQIEPYAVDYVDGAFLFLKREVINQVGLLNEKFFMYGEDMEWCMRARKKNWEVMVMPTVEIIHYYGKSTEQSLSTSLQHSLTNTCNLMNQLHGPLYAILAYSVYMTGLLIRAILLFISNRKKARSYWHAFTHCLRTNPSGRINADTF